MKVTTAETPLVGPKRTFDVTYRRRCCPVLWLIWSVYVLQGCTDSNIMTVARCNLYVSAMQLQQKPNISYRTAKPRDIPAIAKLLVDTFESDDENVSDRGSGHNGGIPAWGAVQRKVVENGYQRQLEERMKTLVQGGASQHALIIATTEASVEDGDDVNDDNSSCIIAGFMELGTMPSPVAAVTTWQGVEMTLRPEMPFLANLAVNGTYRRQGVGTKLVQLAEKIALKWCDESSRKGGKNIVLPPALYLAVEKDNEAAVCLYSSLDFIQILDETEEKARSSKDKEKQQETFFTKMMTKMTSSSSTTSSTSTSSISSSSSRRKPRLYFEKKL